MRRACASLACVFAVCLAALGGERRFVHPGITYTQGDIDRVRAMIASAREPWASAFENLVQGKYSSTNTVPVDRGGQIREGEFNYTIGIDGRRAHDLALLYRLTDDRNYADSAVAYLNANSGYTNTSVRGTCALDNGKITLLIEAAELLRDYDGWAAEEQDRFKSMLVHPGWSGTEDFKEIYGNVDDEKNGVTFYWGIHNFDAGRFGNQGLFAARAMLAMGIYLDNEIIYERSLRYLQGLPHREDDLPYVSGPPTDPGDPSTNTQYMVEWNVAFRTQGTVEDYGYDEQLNNYIFANGQCEESCRDQGHAICGVENYVAIADIAWNQGDDLFSLYDSRILLGLEWSFRYNLSYVLDQENAWEPTGVTSNETEATFENGLFIQKRFRNMRWASIWVSPLERKDVCESSGVREAALAHYAVRAGLDPSRYEWTESYRDYMIENYGPESWGVSPNWFYEWTGWGTLTKRRTNWMAGDPQTVDASGARVPGAHKPPFSLAWDSHDFYPGDGNGHVFKRSGKGLSAGDWNAYTIAAETSGVWRVDVAYSSRTASRATAILDSGESVSGTLPALPAGGIATLGELAVPSGAGTMRICIDGCGSGLVIESFSLVSDGEPTVHPEPEPYVADSFEDAKNEWSGEAEIVAAKPLSGDCGYPISGVSHEYGLDVLATSIRGTTGVDEANVVDFLVKVEPVADPPQASGIPMDAQFALALAPGDILQAYSEGRFVDVCNVGGKEWVRVTLVCDYEEAKCVVAVDGRVKGSWPLANIPDDKSIAAVHVSGATTIDDFTVRSSNGAFFDPYESVFGDGSPALVGSTPVNYLLRYAGEATAESAAETIPHSSLSYAQAYLAGIPGTDAAEFSIGSFSIDGNNAWLSFAGYWPVSAYGLEISQTADLTSADSFETLDVSIKKGSDGMTNSAHIMLPSDASRAFYRVIRK